MLSTKTLRCATRSAPARRLHRALSQQREFKLRKIDLAHRLLDIPSSRRLEGDGIHLRFMEDTQNETRVRKRAVAHFGDSGEGRSSQRKGRRYPYLLAYDVGVRT